MVDYVCPLDGTKMNFRSIPDPHESIWDVSCDECGLKHSNYDRGKSLEVVAKEYLQKLHNEYNCLPTEEQIEEITINFEKDLRLNTTSRRLTLENIFRHATENNP